MRYMMAAKDQKKERRLLTYAVEQAYDGPMLDAVLGYLDSLYENDPQATAADSAAVEELQEKLETATRQHRRELAECIEKRRKGQTLSYKRQKYLATGKMIASDGEPIYLGQHLFGGDGQEWLIVGASDHPRYNVLGLRVDGQGRKGKTYRPLRYEWLTHCPPAKAGALD